MLLVRQPRYTHGKATTTTSTNSEQQQVVIDVSCLSDSEKEEEADGIINENNINDTDYNSRVIHPRGINEDDKSNCSSNESDDDLVF
jgi:hypothetical protein